MGNKKKNITGVVYSTNSKFDYDYQSEEEEETLASNDADALPAADDDSEVDAEDEEKDPLLMETGRVLADYIGLTERRLSQVDSLPNNR